MKSHSSKELLLQVNSVLPFFIFLFTIFSTTSSVSSNEISYSDHCSSIVAEATPTVIEHNAYPVLRPTTSYYNGGERILGKKSAQFPNSDLTFSFRTTQNVYQTDVAGVYKLTAYLSFRPPNMYYTSFRRSNYSRWDSKYGRNRDPQRLGTVRFLLSGFWSESSEMLCMVGSAPWLSKQGKMLNQGAVLKLHYPARNSSISSSAVSGKLESLSSSNDSTYFESISILGFAQMNEYNYSLLSGEFGRTCGGRISIPPNSSLSLQPEEICGMLSWPYSGFRLLEYANNTNCISSNNCTSLAPFMSLYTIQCSEQEKKQRYLIKFSNTSYLNYRQYSFNPNTSLVGEGSWDAKQNRICIVACRIINSTDSTENPQPGDCSIRLILWYPSVWSITKSVSVEGEIWTNKSVNDTGYFESIKFQSIYNTRINNPNLKYEYTQIERATSSCAQKKKQVKKKGERYPNGRSSDMRFNIKVKNSKGKSTWGSAVPISIGDRFFSEYDTLFISNSMDSFVPEKNITYSNPLYISYRISFARVHGYPIAEASILGLPSSSDGSVVITAEGVYDVETGLLCLVGCRDLNEDSPDCEILVNFQFPPVNGKSGNLIDGTIESTRKSNDTRYFEKLMMSSTSIYARQVKRSIWRMDLEITMVLVSNTLACVFIGLQLFHVKKKPHVLPSISITMVIILTLGHMIPLLLNFEAILLGNPNKQNVLLGSGGWVEVNEVIVRVVKMVAFLLQFRLLQQIWNARFSDENGKSFWGAEKKALLVSLPLYVIGGLIALIVSWNKSKFFSSYQRYSLWGDLRAYAGLILDTFLLPQIIVNMFSVSTDTGVLSHSFYIGTTFVRLLPHAYDLYRVQNYVPRHFDGSYIYANPSADFYSKAWDVIIPIGGVLFAVIVFLQQHFGGWVFVPRRFREGKGYEKVGVVSREVEVYEKVPVISSE